jgi:hypothetical protein
MSNIEYGWPLHKRLGFFSDLEKNLNSKKYDAQIQFMDQELVRPVWRIPLTLPKYRLLNGRTSSLQLEWLSTHTDKKNDFFISDPERDEVQEVQHELLKKLINEKDLLPYFGLIENKQQGYLILDHLGFVVNGNRRLCTWRELYHLDGDKYSHFEYIDVIVLPPSDPKAIDKLEGKLEVERDIRADYTWHALANMMLDRMRLHNLDEKSLAEFYDLTEQEVKKYIEMRNYAEEYLKSRDKEGKWSELKDEYAFEKLVEKRKQFNSIGEKRLFEIQAYTLIDDPKGGRLYQFIPDLYKYSESIKERLLEKFPVTIVETQTDDLLGSNIDDEVNLNLAKEIDKDNNRKEAAEIIKDTIEMQNDLRKEENSAKYLLKQLQKANGLIQSALGATKHKDLQKEGVSETIRSIEISIDAIKKWLNA